MIKLSTQERRTASFADLADRFEEYFSPMVGRRGWWPSSDGGTGLALMRLRLLGDERRAIQDETWLNATYAAHKRWQAFRGPKGGVSEARFRTSIAHLKPHLARFRGVAIDDIGPSQLLELLALFRSLEVTISEKPHPRRSTTMSQTERQQIARKSAPTHIPVSLRAE
jgi:hypothetical protein